MGLDAPVVTLPEIEELLAAKYRIGPVQEIHILTGGDNHCYRIITAECDLVLKEMSVNGMNRPEMEPMLVEELARDAIPVAHFYPTLDGSFVWELRGKMFHLQQFIPGRMYTRNRAPSWLLGDSAELLGRIHTCLKRAPRLGDGMGAGWVNGYAAEWMRQSYIQSEEIGKRKGQFSLAADARYRLRLLPLVDRYQFDYEQLTCLNTHGDYRVQQLICGEHEIRAAIDFTSACVHPVIWEVIRSYAFADPACAEGEIEVTNLKAYIARYLEHQTLSAYDLRMMPHFFFYQLLRCNYIQQFFDADESGRGLALDVAVWTTKLCRWFEAQADSLSDELWRSF